MLTEAAGHAAGPGPPAARGGAAAACSVTVGPPAGFKFGSHWHTEIVGYIIPDPERKKSNHHGAGISESMNRIRNEESRQVSRHGRHHCRRDDFTVRVSQSPDRASVTVIP